MSILREMWWGEVVPVERKIQPWEEYCQKLREISQTEEKLMLEVTDKGRELWKQYDELMHKETAISEEDAFVVGFRMGARIMLDVLQGNG